MDRTMKEQNIPEKQRVEVTQDYVRELFEYRDGYLYWRVCKARRIKIGDLAGVINKIGYRHIRIDDKLYYAHRLIFLYQYGFVPKGIDHIDGDKSNNHIENLRAATQSQNQANQKKTNSYDGKPTSSRFKGVSRDKHAKKCRARINIGGKIKHLGMFTSETDAAYAYDAAAIEARGAYAKLNFNSVME